MFFVSKGIIFRSLIDAGKFSWYHAYFDTVAAKDERGRHFIEVNIFKAIQMYQPFQANQVCLWNFLYCVSIHLLDILMSFFILISDCRPWNRCYVHLEKQNSPADYFVNLLTMILSIHLRLLSTVLQFHVCYW